MVNAYTLFGELKANTTQFEKSLRDAENRLQATEKAITKQEQRAVSLGKTTAVTARGYQKLNEKLQETTSKLVDSVNKFQRGETTSKALAKAIDAATNASKNLNSRLADSNARLTDFANKAADTAAKVRAFGQGMVLAGQSMSLYLTAPILAAGGGLVKLGASFDSMRNKMIAATGDVATANAKIKELRQLAQTSAGVFSDAAVDLFAFFKPMKVGEQTINEVIKAFGRLQLADDQFEGKEFGRNLTQLFTQGFEMQDLKQAIGRMPRFAEIVNKQFGIEGNDLNSLKTGLNSLKDSGKLTIDQFLQGFADGVNQDTTFTKLQDTVGIRFQKMMERVFVAVEPLANRILTVLEPMLPPLIALVEQLGASFASLSPYAQVVAVAMAGVAAAIGPILIVAGSLISAITTISTAFASLAAISGIGTALAVVAAALAVTAAGAYALYQAWETNFGNIQGVTQDFVKTAQTAFSTLLTTAQPALDSLKTFALDTFQSLADWWKTNGDDISKAAGVVMTNMSNAIKLILDGVRAFWQTHGQDITAIASAAWNAIKAVVVNVGQVIGSTITFVAALINGDWSKAWNSFQTIVIASLEIVGNIIRGAGSMLYSALQAAFTQMLSIHNWIVGESYKIGEDIGRGMYNGLMAWIDPIGTAARSLAERAVNAAKSTLGIQSPSKVFFGIGEDVVQGFINGINALKSSAQSAMSGILDVRSIKTTKVDTAGVRLLGELTNEIARLGVEGKAANIALDLTAGEFAKLNPQIKEAILQAAQYIDKFNDINEVTQKFNDVLNDLIEIPAKSKLAEINEFLSDDRTNQALAQRASVLGVTVDYLKDYLRLISSLADEATLDPMASGTGINLRGNTNIQIAPTQSMDAEETPPQLKALSKWEEVINRIKDNLGGLGEDARTSGQKIGDALTGAFDRVNNIFLNAIDSANGFFQGVLDGFKNFAKQLISEMLAVLAVAVVVGAITAAFGGGFSSGFDRVIDSGQGGMGGDILGGLFGNRKKKKSVVGGIAGYASGGFTGAGSPTDIAGVVHRNEYVLNASDVRNMGGVAGVERAKNGGGKTINVTMNINGVQDAESFRRSESQIKRGLIASLQSAQGGNA